MRSTISDVEGTEDLCKMSPCGPHSICIPDTVSYRYRIDVEGTEDLCKMSPCGANSICIPDTVSYRYNK